MTALALIIGTLLPALNGWLLLRCVEGKSPVLQTIERWAAGFLVGLTATMTFTFYASVLLHLPLTRTSFLAVQFVCLVLLALVYRRRVGSSPLTHTPVLSPVHPKPLARKWKILIGILILWTAAKIVAGGFLTFETPFMFDDTAKNWNLRGKIFYETHEITNTIPGGGPDILGQLASYPATVSLSKAFYATLAGGWSEPAVDSVHFLWLASVLALLYTFLRRHLSALWALAGVYLLGSLPLYLIHGTQAYADVFLSAHLLFAASMLTGAAEAREESQRLSFLSLFVLAAVLLPYTKNEGLVLYLPIFLLLGAALLVRMWNKAQLPKTTFRNYALSAVTLLAATILPWLLYKWANHFVFGNAHAVSDTSISWHANVLTSVAINLFFEGNWLLLFPLLLTFVFLKARTAFSFPLVLLTGFVGMAMLGQIAVFLFTNIANEALYQTGYSRGVVQVVPIAVALLMFLVAALMGANRSTNE